MLFLHAERWQWHNDDPDYDSYAVLSRLQLSYLGEEGYASLRCIWVLSCPTEISPFADAANQEAHKSTSLAYKKAFEELLPGEPIPVSVGVTRDAVRQRDQRRIT